MPKVELVQMQCPSDLLLWYCTKYENHERYRGDLLEKREKHCPACGEVGMLTGETRPKA